MFGWPSLDAHNMYCCGFPVIYIYNSNSITDDNFKVILNGTQIGTINNNSNSCTGRIFSQDTTLTGPTAPGVTCAVANFEPTVFLDPALLINGSNTLRVESIQNNGAGNAGAVEVATLQNRGTNYQIVRVFLNSGYAFASGVGNGQDFTFNYTAP